MFRDWIDPKEVYNSQTFSANPHPDAIEWLRMNKQNINWDYLSMNINPDAIGILMTDMNKINWSNLSLNSSDAALSLLKRNTSQIQYNKLALNPNMKMLDLIDIHTYWYAMLENPNRDIRKIAIHFAWTYSLNPPGTDINDINWGHAMYPYSLGNLLSMEHKNVKISLKKLIKVTKNFIPEKMLITYKNDPLMVEHVEMNIDNFTRNNEIQWDKLKELWCNPGIFKRSVDISILTEMSFYSKSDTDVDQLRDEMYHMRAQLNDFRSYLSKKGMVLQRKTSLSTEERPSATIDSFDDELNFSRQSSVNIDDLQEETKKELEEESQEELEEELEEESIELSSEESNTRTKLNDAQDEEIKTLKTLIDAQSKEIALLKHIIETQTNKLAILTSTNDEQSNEITTLSVTIVGQANRIETLTRTKDTQTEQITNLMSTIDKQSNEIASLVDIRNDQHNKMTAMSTKIKEQDRRIVHLIDTNTKQMEDLKSYKDSSNKYVIELELLRSENDFQYNEISVLRKTIVYQEQKFNALVCDSVSDHSDNDVPLFGCW